MNSSRGLELRDELVKMTESKNYNTQSTYSTIDKDGLTFVDKHMRYMSQFPLLNCEQYLSNLKLKTKVN